MCYDTLVGFLSSFKKTGFKNKKLLSNKIFIIFKSRVICLFTSNFKRIKINTQDIATFESEVQIA